MVGVTTVSINSLEKNKGETLFLKLFNEATGEETRGTMCLRIVLENSSNAEVLPVRTSCPRMWCAIIRRTLSFRDAAYTHRPRTRCSRATSCSK